MTHSRFIPKKIHTHANGCSGTGLTYRLTRAESEAGIEAEVLLKREAVIFLVGDEGRLMVSGTVNKESSWVRHRFRSC
jgi:hypothetical protein